MKRSAIYLFVWLGLFAMRMLFAASRRYAHGSHGSWHGEYLTAALFAFLGLGLVLAADWRSGAFRRKRRGK